MNHYEKKYENYFMGDRCNFVIRSRHRATERPFYIMSEEHKMTQRDKLVLTITLAAIFFGVFGLGLIGLLFNLSS